MKILELEKAEKKEMLKNLHDCFPTGREFELFLKTVLKKMGFDEIAVTKYSGDMGIDLTCIKKGIDIGGSDTINYYIQAKRYSQSNNVQAKEVRDFKGAIKRDRAGNVLATNYINVFITTSFFTSGARKEAEQDPHRPTILIDGAELLQLCIDNRIGFVYKPILDREEIVRLCEAEKEPVREALRTPPETVSSLPASRVPSSSAPEEYIVERLITPNDVRARILPVPRLILERIPEDASSVRAIVNGVPYEMNLNKARKYLGTKITEIYKNAGMIKENAFIPKVSRWKWQGDLLVIDIG